MKQQFVTILRQWLALVLVATSAAQEAGQLHQRRTTTPVKIIFDTDIGPDCDDAGAIAVLLALERRGEADVLGMMASTTNPWCAPCICAINTWYGRRDIPVGTLKGEGYTGGSDEWPGNAFNGYIAGKYENRLIHGEQAPDALKLYMELLNSQEDHSVTIVVTGPPTNLARLLLVASDSSMNFMEKVLKNLNLIPDTRSSIQNQESSIRLTNISAHPYPDQKSKDAAD